MFKNLKKENETHNSMTLVETECGDGDAPKKIVVRNLPGEDECMAIEHILKEEKDFIFWELMGCAVIAFVLFISFVKLITSSPIMNGEVGFLIGVIMVFGCLVLLIGLVVTAVYVIEKTIIVQKMGENGKYACLRAYCRHLPMNKKEDIDLVYSHLENILHNARNFYNIFPSSGVQNTCINAVIADNDLHSAVHSSILFEYIYTDKNGDLHGLDESIKDLGIVANTNLGDGEYEIDFAELKLRVPEHVVFEQADADLKRKKRRDYL